MNTFLRLTALNSACFILAAIASAQGPLSPPGPPGPTMKTLEQIEPRTPIDGAHTPGDAGSVFRITLPGSYYLTRNLVGISGKNGIEIAASGVTLDLGGFELVGVPGSLDGIRTANAGVTIRNGTVRNWGGDGVDVLSLGIDDTRQLLVNLRVANNGGSGMIGGHGVDIRECSVTGNSGHGISLATRAAITGCRLRANGVNGNGGHGISTGQNARINHCTVTGSAGDGIATGDHSLITDCVSDDNTYGIQAGASSMIKSCVVTGNGSGIRVGDGSMIAGCTAKGNNGAGIFTGNGCTIVDCAARANISTGIEADTGSTISRCTAWGNNGNGIRVMDSCLVLNNNSSGNGVGGNPGSGVYTTGSSNRIEANTVVSNGNRGIYVTGAGNLILGNSASGNTVNYQMAANNKVGTIVLAPNSAAILGDSGGTGVASTNPWANFTF